MNKTLLAGLAVGAIMFGAVGGAGATIIQTDAGLSSPATTIHFDEFGLANLTPVTDQYISMGATFSPLLQNVHYGSSFPHIDNFYLGNYSEEYEGTTPFFINFVNDQTSAAFVFLTNPGSSIFTTYKDGAVIEIASFANISNFSIYNWYVFSGHTFDSIMVDVGGEHYVMNLDNLQLGANSVPEPATMLLFGIGLAGLVAVGHRKKD